MLICGLKITHDGTVALVEDDRLVFSIEMEKLANNPRFEIVEDLAIVESLLDDFGYKTKDVDRFIIDGWEGLDHSSVSVKSHGKRLDLEVAPYREKGLKDDVLVEFSRAGLELGPATYDYTSYKHVAGHIIGAWAASPFATRGESSLVMVWDGGIFPRLYFVNADKRSVDNLGHLFMFLGSTYPVFAQHFGPYRKEDVMIKGDSSVAGKVMAYIALGESREELFAVFDDVYRTQFEPSIFFAKKFSREVRDRIESRELPDADILMTFHLYLQKLLLENFDRKLRGWKTEDRKNLILVGGCALNIKWNSAIRAMGLFEEVWVPPFTNDTGSALGAICCSLFKRRDFHHLKWNVFNGPKVMAGDPFEGWKGTACSVKALAAHIHKTNEPVVILNGQAELGPRALGNRSIFAAATSPEMKTILNMVKKREYYRPVAPICIEDKAPGIFDPGCPDPYMLFDHRVRADWLDRIPAIIHLDGTARLQTMSAEDNPLATEILREYEKLSGIPVLCNTSANFKGCGFFPDVYSATRWGRVNYVWCENVLFEKEDKTDLFEEAAKV
jgi:carbamoyltransferase